MNIHTHIEEINSKELTQKQISTIYPLLIEFYKETSCDVDMIEELTTNGDYLFSIICNNEEIMAFAATTVTRDNNNDKVLHITITYVLEQYRRQGIASRVLWLNMLDIARANDCKHIRSGIFENNDAMLAASRKRGSIIIGQEVMNTHGDKAIISQYTL